MAARRNELGQLIGEALPDWRPAAWPPRAAMHGRFCRVEPFDLAAHGRQLFQAFDADRDRRVWTYLPYGPFEQEGDFLAWADAYCRGDDPLFHAIVDRRDGRAAGLASYLRIAPEAGSIEVGHINLAPALQRTAAATEAMALMMRRAFEELGYRRYEWKCDALNAPSRRAAERLGLRFEGVFRQATVYKGRNRDTAWYAATDKDWPALARAFGAWLAAENFDATGRQRTALSALMPRYASDAGDV